jgi:hypothetical protein
MAILLGVLDLAMASPFARPSLAVAGAKGVFRLLAGLTSPKTSVIENRNGWSFGKRLENPRSFWNSGGLGTSALFQATEGFE